MRPSAGSNLHIASQRVKDKGISEDTREKIRECIAGPIASLMLKLKHKGSNRMVAISNIHVIWDQLKYPALQALQVQYIDSVNGVCGSSAV